MPTTVKRPVCRVSMCTTPDDGAREGALICGVSIRKLASSLLVRPSFQDCRPGEGRRASGVVWRAYAGQPASLPAELGKLTRVSDGRGVGCGGAGWGGVGKGFSPRFLDLLTSCTTTSRSPASSFTGSRSTGSRLSRSGAAAHRTRSSSAQTVLRGNGPGTMPQSPRCAVASSRARRAPRRVGENSTVNARVGEAS